MNSDATMPKSSANTDTSADTSEELVLQNQEVVTISEEVDIFVWTNNLIQYVDDLKIDLYFFNKNYTVYRSKMSGDVSRQLRALFIDQIMEYVLDGSETGLMVRSFEDAESEQGVLQKTLLKNVEKLVYTLNWIKNDQHNIETFVDAEHDIKRIKGVVAHCYHKDMKTPFYVVKNLPSSQVMSGPTAWVLKDSILRPFEDMAALKIPGDNQLLVVGSDLFVFSQSKLKSLFGYDAKAAMIALKKVEEIENKFQLSFDGAATLQSLVFGKPSTIKKLQKIDISTVDQAALISHAEEMGIELLTDDSGAIIIMDDKDLVKFVNLLNDDYVESNMTGQRYEIISKRILKIKESDD
jgi:hypothetical protein